VRSCFSRHGADPENRAAWHLWALAESDPRQRVARWQQVSARFPTDDLARANVADNAAALAAPNMITTRSTWLSQLMSSF
jgi:hypothetical protein